MRLVDGARLAHGTLLLVAPDRMSRALTGVGLDRRATVVARVLAVRHVTQALVGMGTSSTAVRRLGVGVDVLHAGSMLTLATVDPRRRRAALASAAIATLFGIAGWETALPPARRASAATPTPP